MSCRLRQASSADLAALQQLLAEDEGHAMPDAGITRALDSGSNGHDLLLAEIGEQYAGYIHSQLIVDELTVLNLLVRPTWRRQGIAGQLLCAALQSAERGGATRCLLEVRAGNVAALALYRSMGFVEDGRRAGYYPGIAGREDAVLMSVALPARIRETS